MAFFIVCESEKRKEKKTEAICQKEVYEYMSILAMEESSSRWIFA
jgi:hypothetical protein